MKTRIGALAVVLLLSACGDEQAAQVPAEKPPLIEKPIEPIESARPAQPVPVVAAPLAATKAKPLQLPTLPQVPLDLSVSQKMIDELHLGEPAPAEQTEPLLPPLFVEKTNPESSFHVNGRLLLNEQIKDDYVRSVDGAELQLQYKH